MGKRISLFFSLSLMLLMTPVEAKEDERCVKNGYQAYFQARYSSSPYCVHTTIEMSEALNNLSLATNKLEEGVFDMLGFSFWEGWEYTEGYDPILSGYFENSAIGLTVWQPPEYNSKSSSDFSSYYEWIKTHGVQLSLGFGDKEKGHKSRFRFDYRWHEDAGDEFFLQFETPF